MKSLDSQTPLKAPIWILSFGDMITNLLACFVMLLAFRSATNDASFRAGQGSFKRSIQQFGLPAWLMGREDPLFDSRKVRYPTTQSQENGRTTDAEEDDIRRTFETLTRQIDTESTASSETILSRAAASVTFSPGQSELSDQAAQHIRTLAQSYRQSLSRRGVQVLVTGLAPDVAPGRQSQVLSARRANAAADLLRQALAGEIKTMEWEVSAWGAGRGEAWAKAACAKPEQAFLVMTLISGQK